MANERDISGMVFNYLTALNYSHRNKGEIYWTCRCKCGTIKQVNKSKLTYGELKSCGCWLRDRVSVRFIHGMSKSRFYGIWNDIMMRCYNPNKERYPRYGGRGIKVQKRWHIFNNFKDDMFLSYKKGLSIERINVNGNYTSKNCKWIPIKEQHLNKSNTITLKINKEKISVPDAAKKYGVKLSNIYSRLDRGWNNKDAVFGRCNTLKINYKGEKINIKELSDKINVSTQAIRNRIKCGYPIKVCILSKDKFKDYVKKSKLIK